MMRGARTNAEPQPDDDPDVMAKMKRINAAGELLMPASKNDPRMNAPVKIDTPPRSRLFHRCDCGSSMPRVGDGTMKTQSTPIGSATSATNQNTHDQFAN